MKKSIHLFTCLALFLLFSASISAQDCTGISLNRTIQLDGSSDTEEFKVQVTENIKTLQLGINSTIKSGHLTVEVYDPKGNKQGNYSVESQMKPNSKSKELVCGQMQKQIKEPIKGNWIVKLIPKNVKGDVSIHTAQAQEN